MRSQLVEPKLIIADAPRAKRIAATCATCRVVTIAIERALAEKRLRSLLDGADG